MGPAPRNSPAPMIVRPLEIVMVASSRYVPAGAYRTPPLADRAAMALLIAVTDETAPVGSAPHETMFCQSVEFCEVIAKLPAFQLDVRGAEPFTSTTPAICPPGIVVMSTKL